VIAKKIKKKVGGSLYQTITNSKALTQEAKKFNCLLR
jgi:hypothetical protein